jgi:hypothetical protein
MINRRSVMKIGAASIAATVVNSPALAHRRFQRAVFDERFAECRAFAAELDSAGVRTSAIRGDVAKLWYHDLRVHLRENRLPVAGLTDRAAMFCLEELARDVNMRVIFRADHLVDDAGDVRGRQPGFGRTMARLFSRFDSSEPRDASAQKRTGPFSPEGKTALVSWIIAGKAEEELQWFYLQM